jgi:choline dehydrogenase-like flavoprotein
MQTTTGYTPPVGKTVVLMFSFNGTIAPQVNANNRSIIQNRYVTMSGPHNGFLMIFIRGKVLGGSSAINFEIFNRPAAGEYSAWSVLNLGCGGWTWDGILPYFLKTETYVPPPSLISFLNPPTSRRRMRRQDNGTTSSDNTTSIPAPFLDLADSALNLTALNVTSLLEAAGVVDTLSVTNTTSDDSATDFNATKRWELDTRDIEHGTSGPVHPSYNTWYSDIAAPFIETVQNLGVSVNTDPVRPPECRIGIIH